MRLAVGVRCGSAHLPGEIAMQIKQTITPCLWFDTQAEEAANFYVSIFKNSRITTISRYGKAGTEVHGKPAGSVMTVAFELDGQPFVALNGGPMFKFNEAISLQIYCQSQEDVNHFWSKLTAGVHAQAQQCDWLKDQFPVSWQLLPPDLLDMITNPNAAKSQRAFGAMMQMKKLDIAALQRAFDGR